MAKVAFVNDEGGDWIAMYFDGELIDEGHSLDSWRILTPLLTRGGTIESLEYFESNFEEFGRGYDTLDEYPDLRPQ